MFAIKSRTDNAVAPPDQGLQLAQEEATIAGAEARAAARMAAVLENEQAIAVRLSQQREELKALTASRAGGMAVEALGKLPPWSPKSPAPLPERVKANEARRAAIDSRRRALVAEEKDLAEREGALGRIEQGVAALRQAVAAIRQKGQELAEADQAAAERERAEKARAAAERVRAEKALAAAERERAATARTTVRPAPTARPTERVGAPRPAASGAMATGPEEMDHADPYGRQRRTQRVALNADVDFFSDSNFYTGFSSDLSDGGIFVATCNLLDPGTEVEIAFTLPGNHRIQARGVVRWHREFNDRYPEVFPGMGIEFVEMPEDSRSAVHTFTAQREPMFWAS